jgi:5-(carboxyamino)imidazole ribonucleotide synthase
MLEPLPAGSTIGILGGGQLGKMLAQAAAKLGFRVCVLAPERGSPAFAVSAAHICADYDDAHALAMLADEADVVTFEFENVSAEALAVLEGATRVAPQRQALEVTQDRLLEKRFVDALGLATAQWAPASGAGALASTLDEMGGADGGPFFLKMARQGYDGKGQLRLAGPGELEKAAEWLGERNAVLERAVAFEMELSVIAVRANDGAMAFYDLPHNLHQGGVLRESLVPAGVPEAVRREAEDIARRIAEAFGYVGVLAVEMFFEKTAEGERLLVNEIAPRVHNSGHWTIEACAISQFENHIRAIAGWPLGSTARHSDARLVNLLGDEVDAALELMTASPARSLHLYGKREARAGRKMGHYVELGPPARAGSV